MFAMLDQAVIKHNKGPTAIHYQYRKVCYCGKEHSVLNGDSYFQANDAQGKNIETVK